MLNSQPIEKVGYKLPGELKGGVVAEIFIKEFLSRSARNPAGTSPCSRRYAGKPLQAFGMRATSSMSPIPTGEPPASNTSFVIGINGYLLCRLSWHKNRSQIIIKNSKIKLAVIPESFIPFLNHFARLKVVFKIPGLPHN
ncbi:hypothetical protein [Methylomonas lenta]|uniref:hypothetical protein n=1 Tax=Methylomonas lenta TaxID=980561 RepID=UPI00082C65BA|nr:hypothetical protein [Methylomonas lenta]